MKSRDIAIEVAKFFETKLVQQGAKGKGLHSKVSSIEACLPEKLVRRLRKIATIRNEQLHESDAGEIDVDKFVVEALELAFMLGNRIDSPRTNNQPPQHSENPVQAIPQLTQRLQTKALPILIEQPVKSVEIVRSEDQESQLSPELPPTTPTQVITIKDVLSQMPRPSRRFKSTEKMLSRMIPVLTEDELEQIIDESITKAQATHYQAYYPWSGFVFIAEQKDTLVDDRLKSLALAIAAGAETSYVAELARKMKITPCGD